MYILLRSYTVAFTSISDGEPSVRVLDRELKKKKKPDPLEWL